MTNVILGVAFVVVAIAVMVWRTIVAARTVVSGEMQPSARAQTGIAGDYSGIAAGADGGGVVGMDAGGGACGADGGGSSLC